jgi:predicted nucleic-acid-binding Zn-ribbon protein
MVRNGVVETKTKKYFEYKCHVCGYTKWSKRDLLAKSRQRAVDEVQKTLK